MDESVLVIVGEWECGNWHLRVSNERYEKCVDVSAEEKFEEVEVKVANVFGINLQKEKSFLSFW